MNKLNKYHATIGAALLFLGLNSAWAAGESGEPAATAKQSEEKFDAETLRREIASPVSGEFAAGSQMGWGSRSEVGGFSGNGFINSSGRTGDIPTTPSRNSASGY